MDIYHKVVKTLILYSIFPDSQYGLWYIIITTHNIFEAIIATLYVPQYPKLAVPNLHTNVSVGFPGCWKWTLCMNKAFGFINRELIRIQHCNMLHWFLFSKTLITNRILHCTRAVIYHADFPRRKSTGGTHGQVL